MNKNVLISGIAGTIVYYLLGWLVYDILFPQMSTGDESMLGIFLGCLCYMFIYALIFVRWAHITTFKTGVTTGFVLGLLYALSWQAFTYTGHLDVSNFIHEILIGSIMTAFGAGTVAFFHGKVA